MRKSAPRGPAENMHWLRGSIGGGGGDPPGFLRMAQFFPLDEGVTEGPRGSVVPALLPPEERLAHRACQSIGLNDCKAQRAPNDFQGPADRLIKVLIARAVGCNSDQGQCGRRPAVRSSCGEAPGASSAALAGARGTGPTRLASRGSGQEVAQSTPR